MSEGSAAARAEPDDRVLRAMTNDGSFRVLVASTTALTRAVVAAQSVTGETRTAIANILTSAVLIRETMAPTNRVQVVFHDQHGSQIIGDAFPDGKTRGLARIKDGASGVSISISIGAGGRFQVERVIRTGKSHQGVVPVDDGDDLVLVLRRYFQQSEQVTSMVDLACVVEAGEIVGSAGFVVQLLPELTDPPLAAMNARLQAIGPLTDVVASGGADRQAIMATILGIDGLKAGLSDAEAEHTILSDTSIRFGCPCDRDRVRMAAAALGQDEIQKLLAADENLSISCDYCREPYTLGIPDYRSILDDLSA